MNAFIYSTFERPQNSNAIVSWRWWWQAAIFFGLLLLMWLPALSANAATGSCDYATGRGATGPVDYAKYCWIDFTGYNDSQARSNSGQNFTITLPAGTLTFNLKVSGGAITKASVPLWPGAAFGHSAFTGIPDTPSLYQTNNSGTTTTLTLSNLTVSVSGGQLPYTFVATDAESTNNGETLTFKQTDGTNWYILSQMPNGNSTVYPSLTGTNTAIVKETGVAGTVGAYAFASDFPASNTIGSVTAELVGSGLQGVAFGIKYHAADLSISKTHSPTSLEVGGTGSYTLSVHNNGPEKNHWNSGDITTVTDTLPAGLSYVAAGSGGTGWSCSAAGQVVTCTSSASVNSGNDMSPITINVQVDSNGNNVASSVTNTATVSNIYDYVSTNNTANDVTPIVHSSLVTSTKVASDLNGGDVNPGDVIQYTLTLAENHGVAANGVSVVDNLTNDVGSLDVVSTPSGSSDNSTTSGGTHGSGQVNITGINVPANGSVQIVYKVTVASSATIGNTYTNTATITNPDSNGAGASPSAIFSVGAPPSSGNKVLYIHTSNDSLQRIPQTGTGGAVTLEQNDTHDWTLTPALAKPLKLVGGTDIGVKLLVKCGHVFGNGCFRANNLKWTATLYDNSVSAANRIGNISGNVTFNHEDYTLESATVTVPTGGVTLPTGHQLILRITNSSSRGFTRMQIEQYQTSPKRRSYITLNTSTVINVDNVKVYSAAYPATTQSSTYTPGQTVYVRAVVSDPFGSDDIDPSSGGVAPTLTIKDSGGITQLTATNMTQVVNSDAATKTFEYSYTIPTSGDSGYWTPSVKATEGNASVDALYNGTTTITHTASGAFDVESPNLLVMKSVQVLSDPTGHVPPHALPGATLQYTIKVQNNGQGEADTDSIKLTDKLDSNVNYQVGSASFADGSPSSNLSFSPTGDVQYCSNTNSGCTSYTTSVGNGNTDPNIRKIIFTPSGRLAGKANAAAPSPNFSIHYKAIIH